MRLYNFTLITIELYGCNKSYSLHTEPPTTTEPPIITSEPLRNEMNTSGMTCTCPECPHKISETGLNQTCHETNTVESCTNTVTIRPVKSVYISTTVHLSVRPSSTTESTSKGMEKTTNIPGVPTNSYPASSSTCSPDLKRSKVLLTLLNIVIPATGALVGLLIVLLLVVITGWICSRRNMKKRGEMEINMMQDRYYSVN